MTIAEVDLTLPVGEQLSLTASVQVSGAAETSVVWTRSEAGVAVVTHDGLVTGVGPGSAIVTATSVVDGSKSAAVTVEVREAPGVVDPARVVF